MKINCDKKTVFSNKVVRASGFSLAEIIAVLIISSLVIVTALSIFHRVKTAAAAINKKLDKEDTAEEILQRIAEDLDRLAVSGTDIKITLNNKTKNGFNISQLVIESKYYGKNKKPQTFEKVTWQSDYDTSLGMLILYRSHTGLNVEDKIYIEEIEEYPEGTELFVPLCWGMSLFEIFIPQEDSEPMTKWHSKTLPASVQVSISFADPVENFDGSYEILPEDIITRTIAIDRTRKIRFVFVKKDFDFEDPNDLDDQDNDPNDIDTTKEDEETEEGSEEDEEETDEENKE